MFNFEIPEWSAAKGYKRSVDQPSYFEQLLGFQVNPYVKIGLCLQTASNSSSSPESSSTSLLRARRFIAILIIRVASREGPSPKV